jgi:hypothetical protein
MPQLYLIILNFSFYLALPPIVEPELPPPLLPTESPEDPIELSTQISK